MEIALILKVAGVGILISVLNMILEKVDRKDWATLTTGHQGEDAGGDGKTVSAAGQEFVADGLGVTGGFPETLSEHLRESHGQGKKLGD